MALAALLLLVAMTAYAAHHHQAGGYTSAAAAEHCDLCLQLHASAGPPATAPDVQGHPEPLYQLPVPGAVARPAVPLRHVLQPRAPPLRHDA